MAKRISRYAAMTTSELAAETRKRGLTKPEGMINISEWADFLEADDAKAAEVPAPVEADEKPIKPTKKPKTDE